MKFEPSQSSTYSIGKLLLWGFGIVVVLVVSGIAEDVGRNGFKQDQIQPDASDDLAVLSRGVNQRLPKMVDEGTRADSSVVGPGLKWTYLYTFIYRHSSEVSSKELQAALGQKARSHTCATMGNLLVQGVTIVHRYRGNDGGVIGDIVVSPSDCASAIPTKAPPASQSSQHADPGSTSAEVDYSNPHNERCWDAYQNSISQVPEDASLGYFAEIKKKAQRKLDSCVRHR